MALRYVEPQREDEGAFSPEENEVLTTINQKIAAGESLKEILSFLFDKIQQIFTCDRIGISFFTEKGARMELYAVLALYEPLYLTEGYTADLKGSSLSRVFNQGNPRIINDLEEYGREHPGSDSTSLLLKEGVLSSMTCPLRVDDRPVGLLFFSSRERDAYSEKELKMQLAITERLSQAVEKAYRIEELTRSFNNYMEMLSFVTHELKSPLDSIVTLGKTVTGGYHGDIDEKIEDLVSRMVARAEGLSSMVIQYLNLARFESDRVRENFRETDFIHDILEPGIDLVTPQAEKKGMGIEKDLPETLAPVNCDTELMKIVVNNLLSNAVKYGNDRGLVRITVSDSETGITCSVWNEGPGFPQDQKKNLFKKFSRIQTDELLKRKGSGIGLYTSWRIMLLHDGTIHAESEEGKWAEFYFELPREAR